MDLIAQAKIIVRAPPEMVFDAFVNPEKMRRFWFQRKDSGLREKSTVTFYIGEGDKAFGFPARIIELVPHSLIHIRWGEEGSTTTMRWALKATDEGDTVLTIEESGFRGTDAEIIARALDSTGGFNQVIVAAKALIEHDVAMQLIDDHA